MSGVNPAPTGSATQPRSNRARTVGLVVAAATIAFDQLSKSLVVAHIGADREVHIVGSLRLIRRFNTGMAFSKGSGSPVVGWFVGIVVVVLAVWVLRTLWREPGTLGAPTVGYGAALGALLGGALGNKIDRLIRNNGAVVDFVDVGFWPVFNVADAALSLACVALVLLSFRPDAVQRSAADNGTRK